MRSAKRWLILLTLAGLALAVAAVLRFQARQREQLALAEAADRAARSLALAHAQPEQLSARYVAAAEPADLAAPSAAAPPAGALALWQVAPADAPLAWCPATGKLAFFRDGWIWVTDAKAKVVRTLWFEPDLQAAGRLRWSADGTLLWIRADAWRRWVSLQVSPGP